MTKNIVLGLLVLVVGVAQAGIYSYRGEDGSIVFTDESRKGAKQVKVKEPMTVPATRLKSAALHKTPSDIRAVWPEPEEKMTGASRASAGEAPAYGALSDTHWGGDSQGITSNRAATKEKGSRQSLRERVSPGAASEFKKKPSKKTVEDYEKLTIVSPKEDSARWVGGELTVELALQPPLQAEHVVSLRVDGKEVVVGPSLQIVVPDVARGSHTVRASVLDVDTGEQLIVSDKVQFQVHRANKNQNSRMLHPSLRRGKK